MVLIFYGFNVDKHLYVLLYLHSKTYFCTVAAGTRGKIKLKNSSTKRLFLLYTSFARTEKQQNQMHPYLFPPWTI
jgi:hypothetical protein